MRHIHASRFLPSAIRDWLSARPAIRHQLLAIRILLSAIRYPLSAICQLLSVLLSLPRCDPVVEVGNGFFDSLVHQLIGCEPFDAALAEDITDRKDVLAQ